MGGIISRLRQVHSLTNSTSLSISLPLLGHWMNRSFPIIGSSSNKWEQERDHNGRKMCQASCQDRNTRHTQPHSKPRSTLSADKPLQEPNKGHCYFLLYNWINTLKDDWRPNDHIQPARWNDKGGSLVSRIFSMCSFSAHAHASVYTKASNTTGLEASDNAKCKMLVPVQP